MKMRATTSVVAVVRSTEEFEGSASVIRKKEEKGRSSLIPLFIFIDTPLEPGLHRSRKNAKPQRQQAAGTA
ncbi:uncharacterized protein G2W53_027240 [Senna tora]|uniref:Uncharacterized protein n=1 Tax=Senna tora TaxID=362788 RepID=A0A834TIZ4_9FABA|nr:uncharacterized protein G2W53_027240 [Senna tora]